MTQSQSPSPPQAASVAPPGSRLPLVALLLSLFGLCTFGLGAIAGLVCGIVALKTGKGSSGLATAAIIIGALVIVFWFVGCGPTLGILIFLRNEIKEWVRDIWQQAKEDTAQEKDDFFGDRPRDTAPLPWPAPAQPR